jgi:hypothetical protein
MAPPPETWMRSLPEVGLLERSKRRVGEVRASEAAVRVPGEFPRSAPGARIAPEAVVREPPMVPVPLSVALAATLTGELPKVPNSSSDPEFTAVVPLWLLLPESVRTPVPVLVIRALPANEPEKFESVSSPPIV